MPLFKKCENFTRVRDIQAMGIYPYFHELESRQDVEVIMEGQRRIMLGSNNYLGLTVHPDVIQAGIDALKQYGTGCSGSRFLNGTLNLHTQLERELAEFVGYEGAVTFSTGFQSNLGIISGITDRTDYIFNDRENHASIYDGCMLSFARVYRYHHSDMEDLERQLQKVPIDAGKLIITDGVFSMSGDICKLPEIVALAEKYKARVMVDDAHGFGVIGEGGRGTASYFGLTDKVDIVMGTFSKSLASLGGFMLAKEEVCSYVRHNSRPFMFSASIPPACAATAIAALHVIEKEPERVKRIGDLAEYMRKKMREKNIALKDGGCDRIPIIPFYTYDEIATLEIAKELFDKGVYVNPVLPPAAPAGECMLRTSLMATHTEALIDEAVGIIAEVAEKRGLIK